MKINIFLKEIVYRTIILVIILFFILGINLTGNAKPKRCSYKLIPPTITWTIGSVARTPVALISNIRSIKSAILVPIDWPVPIFIATDTSGLPLYIHGVQINFTEDSLVRNEVNLLHPPPSGKKWRGYKSTPYPPSQISPDSTSYLIYCKWTDGLPIGFQDDINSAEWESNDADDLYGEIVIDEYYILGKAKPFPTNVNITLVIEGHYVTTSNHLSIKDTVIAFLRNANSPFALIDTSKAVIDSVNLYGNYIFKSLLNGNYFIVIKHRNSLETWSKSGGELILTTDSVYQTYNFTSFSSQAFGNNMILKGTKYCLYSGDVDQDGIIDASDLSFIDTDGYNMVYGYVSSDLTGDNFVDISDMAIVDNNGANGIMVISP